MVAGRPIGSSRLQLLQLLSKPTRQGLLSPRGSRKSHREAPRLARLGFPAGPGTTHWGADWLAVVHKIIWPPVGQGQHYQNPWTEREGGRSCSHKTVGCYSQRANLRPTSHAEGCAPRSTEGPFIRKAGLISPFEEQKREARRGGGAVGDGGAGEGSQATAAWGSEGRLSAQASVSPSVKAG